MAIDESRISRAFCFVLHDGTKIYPIRRKRRDTENIAFRVSQRGNTVHDSEEVDEPTMIRKVLTEGFAVRCSSLDGAVQGIYREGHRAVRSVIRIQSS